MVQQGKAARILTQWLMRRKTIVYSVWYTDGAVKKEGRDSRIRQIGAGFVLVPTSAGQVAFPGH